jgi:hypothetical protein
VSWTVEQVLGLAPDASAARAARDLGVTRKWQGIGRSADAAWGECRGTAAQPYRVAVDLGATAFNCTCPSRKVPCKHALALMLMVAADTTNGAEPPEWVSEWLSRQRERASKRTPPQATAAADGQTHPSWANDPLKRARGREERISRGIDELDRWLKDLVRAGLADAATRPWSAYEQISARLVDAQAPGLARAVRDLGALPYTAGNWPERMLIDIGQLWLLIEGWRRRDALQSGLQHEVRLQVGINEAREAVLAKSPVRDIWDALGRRVLEGERMRVQRTWLWGRRAQRWALLLDFSVGGQPIEQSVTPGASFEADVCFYGGASPMRGIIKGQPVRAAFPTTPLPARDVHHALHLYAEILGRNPWIERFPIALKRVLPRRAHDDSWWLVEEGGSGLRVDGPFGWHLLALSGGEAVDVFGEWDGFTLQPLSVLVDGALIQLQELAPA